jgi:hypothetical protein
LDNTACILSLKSNGKSIKATLIVSETDGKQYSVPVQNNITLKVNEQSYALELVNYAQNVQELGKSILFKKYITSRTYAFKLSLDQILKIAEVDDVKFYVNMIFFKKDPSKTPDRELVLDINKEHKETLKEFAELINANQER